MKRVSRAAANVLNHESHVPSSVPIPGALNERDTTSTPQLSGVKHGLGEELPRRRDHSKLIATDRLEIEGRAMYPISTYPIVSCILLRIIIEAIHVVVQGTGNR